MTSLVTHWTSEEQSQKMKGNKKHHYHFDNFHATINNCSISWDRIRNECQIIYFFSRWLFNNATGHWRLLWVLKCRRRREGWGSRMLFFLSALFLIQRFLNACTSQLNRDVFVGLGPVNYWSGHRPIPPPGWLAGFGPLPSRGGGKKGLIDPGAEGAGNKILAKIVKIAESVGGSWPADPWLGAGGFPEKCDGVFREWRDPRVWRTRDEGCALSRWGGVQICGNFITAAPSLWVFSPMVARTIP